MIDTLRLFARDQLEEKRLEELWRMHFVDQQVRSALEGLFGNESDPALIRLVKKHTSGLSYKEVTASLGRLRIDLDFPAIVPSNTSTDSSKGETKPPVITPNVSLQQLIAGGAFKPPLDIEGKYKGTTLRARIEENGTITLDGKPHPSLSHAGGVARMRVQGASKPPATNGWSFWRYRKPDGTLEKLGDLRARFCSRK